MTIRIPTLTGALALALIAAAFTAPAHAEDLPGTTRFFETYDRNSDGVVSAEEFDGSKDVFRLLDKDGDGSIQAVELGLPADYRPTRRQRPQAGAGAGARKGRKGDGANKVDRDRRLRKAIEKMDKNADGKVTKEEWTGPEALFERVDRNDDGVIDQLDSRRPQAMDGMDGPMGGDRPTTAPDGAAPGGRAPNKGPRNARRGRGGLEKLDVDGDGKISREEWPGREVGFERLDRNEDGFLEPDELPSRAAGAGTTDRRAGDRKRKVNKQMIKRFDGNRDGRVSRDEFPGSDERFDSMDEDRDGTLTDADIEAAKQRETAEQKPLAKPDKLFKRMDKDGDGKLNRAEYGGSDEDWQRCDTNKDGWLTPDELSAR